MESAVPTRELCALSLDYAWYHTAGSFVIVALCVFGRRWTALKASHWFGVFAMVMDFGVMFLLKGSRTVDWAAEGATGPFPFVPPPPYPVNITGVTPPMPPLTPVGTIAFFAWYDYLGAVGVMLFAFSVIHRKTKLDWFLLFFTPALFWSAPVASPWLGLDSRVLLVTRPSPKHLYVKLLAGMFVPLVLLRPKQVWSVYVAGVACGVTHHAALFFHGMRGYTSMTALFATVLTEWPVLVVGTFLCTDLLRRGKLETHAQKFHLHSAKVWTKSLHSSVGTEREVRFSVSCRYFFCLLSFSAQTSSLVLVPPWILPYLLFSSPHFAV